MEYTRINMETWPRRSHWEYYRNTLKAGVSATKTVDITKLRAICRDRDIKFSPLLLHKICLTVNELECTRLFALENGDPAIWKEIHPNFTIFHEDDQTFSDIWIEYSPDQETFLETYRSLMEQYKDKKGIKIRDNQPPNFFCVSGAPWFDFDAVSTSVAGDLPPALFPVLNYGRFREENGRILMPVSISVSHAAMDGYHIALFFETLQKKLSEV
ncbi:MAG: CatA-like O-acetyltransferase [Lachnospiraceae bacterium]|nr:CatA-like O-acetyltransferase [Lachnospiraceae bacterium]